MKYFDLEEKVKAAVKQIRVHSVNGIESPHKLIFILTLLRTYELDESKQNEFVLDDRLEYCFQDLWESFLNEKPPNNSIENPFYHLQSDLFWFLKIKEDKADIYNKFRELPNKRFTKQRLIETIEYGYLENDFHTAFQNKSIRNAIESICIERIVKKPLKELEAVEFNKQDFVTPNPFVAYLNSLHSCDSGNENALAESQACNEWFKYIHAAHPVVKSIIERLTTEKPKHIILTGHAGDGKSTIALEVYKELKGIPKDQSLNVPPALREDIAMKDGKKITIIKDLSEWGDGEKDNLMSEIIKGDHRFLLVTNTGTMLDLFCRYAFTHLGMTKADVEPGILKVISSSDNNNYEYAGRSFSVYNLALMDNLSIAEIIFKKMIDPERWNTCYESDCYKFCPIHRNITLINECKNTVLTRLFMAYRRMYEYGTRLTLRQITAHFAYMITSGLNYSDIINLDSNMEKPLMSEFMFFSRFFGDNGKEDDSLALQLKAIKEIKKQGFCEHPAPIIERKLWLQTRGSSFKIGIDSLEDEFGKLKSCGSGSEVIAGLSPDQAREQVRRMIYFLHEFEDETDYRLFLSTFLDSPSIYRWWDWQTSSNANINDGLKQNIFHVLQEHFTGIRLPENSMNEQVLYITLSRRNQEIRQSSQIVLAQIDFARDLKIELKSLDSGAGIVKKQLWLSGRGLYEGINLPLQLPFLDYVLMRHKGEAGQILLASYDERLNRLKAMLIEKSRQYDNDNDVLLVKLGTNRRFIRQRFSVIDNRLEVSNA